ncbi:MAG: cyclic nucleotide-binding domain-containing protein [Oligoflexales bacterium]
MSEPVSSRSIASIYKPGEPIFSEGEQGGSMFFIKEGEVEIFTHRDGKDVMLSIMKSGEVMGTLTCITNANRLASARAKTKVVLMSVSHEKISGIIAKLPKWVSIVLKDFTQRLQHMNLVYTDALNKLEKARETQISLLYTSSQFASAIATCAEDKHVLLDEVKGLLPETILEYCEGMLNRPREELEEIFKVFISCGMITLKIEQEKKRKFFTLENAKKIRDFCYFVQQTQRKKIKKILNTNFRNKELRIIGSMIRYVEILEKSLDKQVDLKVSELAAKLEKKVGQKFDRVALSAAKSLGLVKIEGERENITVSFVPKDLSHTITHVAVYHRILKLEGELEKESK